jgi:hypothetical protein
MKPEDVLIWLPVAALIVLWVTILFVMVRDLFGD